MKPLIPSHKENKRYFDLKNVGKFCQQSSY